MPRARRATRQWKSDCCSAPTSARSPVRRRCGILSFRRTVDEPPPPGTRIFGATHRAHHLTPANPHLFRVGKTIFDARGQAPLQPRRQCVGKLRLGEEGRERVGELPRKDHLARTITKRRTTGEREEHDARQRIAIRRRTLCFAEQLLRRGERWCARRACAFVTECVRNTEITDAPAPVTVDEDVLG